MTPITAQSINWILRSASIFVVVAALTVIFIGGCPEGQFFTQLGGAFILSLPVTGPFLFVLWRTRCRISWYSGIAILWFAIAFYFAFTHFAFGFSVPAGVKPAIATIWVCGGIIPILGFFALIRFAQEHSSAIGIGEGLLKASVYLAVCLVVLVFGMPNVTRGGRAAHEANAVGQLRLIRECFTNGDGENCASKINNPSWGYRFYWRSKQGRLEDAQARPTRFECSGISSFLIDANGKIYRTQADREASVSDELLNLPAR
jgi:hypothetical protein